MTSYSRSRTATNELLMKTFVDSPQLFWKNRSVWNNFFQESEWVIDGGHYDGLYPKQHQRSPQSHQQQQQQQLDQNNVIEIPSVSVYDVRSKRHWTTTHTTGYGDHRRTHTKEHYRITGRRIITGRYQLSSSNAAFLRGCRALKIFDRSTQHPYSIRNRYVVSRSGTGPVPATEAFRSIINQKYKRANQLEVIVDTEMLQDVLRTVQLINQSGGYSTCTIAATANTGDDDAIAVSSSHAPIWWIVKNWTILGPPVNSPQHHSLSVEHKSESYEYNKTRPVEPCMVYESNATPMYRVPDYVTTEVLPIAGGEVVATSSATLSIPCRRVGYRVLNNKHGYQVVDDGRGHGCGPDIGRIDYPIQVSIDRPLVGMECKIGYDRKNSSTKCPELIAVKQPKATETATSVASHVASEIDTRNMISPLAPLSVLGANIESVDGQPYVRIRRDMRRLYNKQIKKAQEAGTVQLLPYFVPILKKNANNNSSNKVNEKYLTHKAGRKGYYKIYEMKLIVLVDGNWYWLESLKPVAKNDVERIQKYLQRKIRYLHLDQNRQHFHPHQNQPQPQQKPKKYTTSPDNSFTMSSCEEESIDWA